MTTDYWLLFIPHHLSDCSHVAGADDAETARVSFYTQSAVRLKAARRALEALPGERDAPPPPARKRRARPPLAHGRSHAVLRLENFVAARERARERGEQVLAVWRTARLLFDRGGALQNLRRAGAVPGAE